MGNGGEAIGQSEQKADLMEGYHRSQHLKDGGAVTERTTGRISWGEKRTKDRLTI
jgi:hypothetical protein